MCKVNRCRTFFRAEYILNASADYAACFDHRHFVTGLVAVEMGYKFKPLAKAHSTSRIHKPKRFREKDCIMIGKDCFRRGMLSNILSVEHFPQEPHTHSC